MRLVFMPDRQAPQAGLRAGCRRQRAVLTVAVVEGDGAFVVAGLPRPGRRAGQRPRRGGAPAARAGPVRCCPRLCRVNRLADQRGLCAVGRQAVVASHFPHFGEEDCLRGWNGSGTIFFSGCNLRCVFCQNYEISWQEHGER